MFIMLFYSPVFMVPNTPTDHFIREGFRTLLPSELLQFFLVHFEPDVGNTPQRCWSAWTQLICRSTTSRR